MQAAGHLGPGGGRRLTDSLLRSEPDGPALVGLGLLGIVAVATGDAVLVADKSRAQEVRVAVERLEARAAPQARKSAHDHRPWGWFETLALGPRLQVKRIVVRPGGVLSLQSHVHRAEHWIVVCGAARVTLDDEVRLIAENQSVYIPLGTRHRLEKPSKLPMILIKVQTGAYVARTRPPGMRIFIAGINRTPCRGVAFTPILWE